jgi:hypothetical protein
VGCDSAVGIGSLQGCILNAGEMLSVKREI